MVCGPCVSWASFRLGIVGTSSGLVQGIASGYRSDTHKISQQARQSHNAAWHSSVLSGEARSQDKDLKCYAGLVEVSTTDPTSPRLMLRHQILHF